MSTHWQNQIERQSALAGTTQTGVIILGDISGYSELVAKTELVHAQDILLHLFDKMYAQTGDDFIVNEIEGDAIFAYAVSPADPGKLLAATVDQIKDYGHAFYHAKEEMLDRQRRGEDSGCACGACANIAGLSLKFIVHYGQFGLNRIGPFVKLVGGSVVVAHRLLKNSVPSHSYLLLSEEALQHLPQAMQASFVPLTERITHFGDVPVAYRIFDFAEEDKKHHEGAD